MRQDFLDCGGKGEKSWQPLMLNTVVCWRRDYETGDEIQTIKSEILARWIEWATTLDKASPGHGPIPVVTSVTRAPRHP